jgi:thiamine biosynthesis lipoprotein
MRRRRLLRVLAAGAGLTALAVPYPSAARLHHRWRGSALGAESRIDLWLDDVGRARRLIQLCLAEIDRLERIFSLHRRDSAVSVLNREGLLLRPPLELVTVLGSASQIAELTGGIFDVTVQPLWRLYADHFARPGSDPAGPGPGELERVGRLVGHTAIERGPGAVRLTRPGMAVSLNGIAQGFIADRLASLLQESGLTSVLLDVGEIATVGAPSDGEAWQVRAGAIGTILALDRGAVATSSPAALTFDIHGRFPHLLDPRALRPCRPVAEATVVADSAMIADAYSTALAIDPALAARGWRARRILLNPISAPLPES